MAENGELIIKSLIDGISCDAGTKKLIQQMACFCSSARLTSEKALKQVKELAKQNKGKQQTQTTIMTEETKARFAATATHDTSLFKKANQREELAKQNEGEQQTRTIIMTEETEHESCDVTKKARFSATAIHDTSLYRKANQRKELAKQIEGKQPTRTTVMTEETEFESCDVTKKARFSATAMHDTSLFKHTRQRIELTKQNESKQPHQTAVMTEEPEIKSCSGAKNDRFSELAKQTERKRLPQVMIEESEAESCSGQNKARFSVKRTQVQEKSAAAESGSECGTIRKQQTVELTGYPLPLQDQLMLKKEKRSTPAASKTGYPVTVKRTQVQEKSAAAESGSDCGTIRKQQTVELTGYPLPLQDQLMLKKEKRSTPAASKTGYPVTASPDGNERALIQSPQGSQNTQSMYGNDLMKPQDERSHRRDPGFHGGFADTELDDRSKQGNIPNFDQINN